MFCCNKCINVVSTKPTHRGFLGIFQKRKVKHLLSPFDEKPDLSQGMQVFFILKLELGAMKANMWYHGNFFSLCWLSRTHKDSWWKWKNMLLSCLTKSIESSGWCHDPGQLEFPSKAKKSYLILLSIVGCCDSDQFWCFSLVLLFFSCTPIDF